MTVQEQQTYMRKPSATRVQAVQFLANGPDTKPVPGMELWRDRLELPQPRDMSWGFVTALGPHRHTVKHRDWILTYPSGQKEVWADSDFQQVWKPV